MSGQAWIGRRGPVILGPTEARVARYLDELTRSGWARLRTADLAERLQLERSEAYRITRRLRVLGLFGVANDPAGARGGRRWWRTSIPHDGAELDATRHRLAWARVRGWARATRARVMAGLDHIRRASGAARRPDPFPRPAPASPGTGRGPGPSFRELMARYGYSPPED